jgi:hypothetical protein
MDLCVHAGHFVGLPRCFHSITPTYRITRETHITREAHITRKAHITREAHSHSIPYQFTVMKLIIQAERHTDLLSNRIAFVWTRVETPCP